MHASQCCSSQNRTPARQGRFDAVVELNQPLCKEHYLLRIRVEQDFPATRPGQFIQLGCRPPATSSFSSATADPADTREHHWQPGVRLTHADADLLTPTAFLRRPFSLAGRIDHSTAPDQTGNTAVSLDVLHRVVGVGTAYLASLKPGDPIDLIGPLGNSFDLPPGKSLGLLVGGGVGLPPMFYLAQALKAAGWNAVAFVGALSRDLLAVTFDQQIKPAPDAQPTRCVTEFGQYQYPAVITTNDGSIGLKGFVTQGLDLFLKNLSPQQRSQTVIYTCGPHAMMRAVADLAAAYNTSCQACLEQAMACGMGACQSCVVQIEDPLKPQAKTPSGRPWRYKLACTDGPIFDSTLVVW